MKFGKVGQVTLVSAIALLVATLFTACGTLNVGFLFVPTNKQTPGQIEVYEVDSESGSLRTIPTSPFPSGGRDPIAEAVDSNYKNLYVVNQDDNNIVQFGIGTDGKLYPQATVNTPGSFPLALALNSTHTFLYAVDTLAPIAGCTLTNPCPGNVFVCPINSDGSLGTPVNNTKQCLLSYPLRLTPADATTVLTPTALSILANDSTLYVTAYNQANKKGYIFPFTINGDGSLSALNGGNPLSAGSQPAAMTSDSSAQALYVADQSANQIYSYTVQSSGTPLALKATIGTGGQPTSLAMLDDKFLYVTNSADSNVTAYSVSSGNMTNIATYASDVNPIAITVDPRKVGFLYTVNFLGSSLSGYKINPDDGTLINTQRTPYASSVQPTAITGIPHNGTTTK
jgi:6-phosphogluconolactonase